MSIYLRVTGWLLVVGATATAAIAFAQNNWLIFVAMVACATAVATTLTRDR